MKLAKDITGEDLVALGFVHSPERRYLYTKGLVSVGILHMQTDGQSRVSVSVDGPPRWEWSVEFTGSAPASLVQDAIRSARRTDRSGGA